MHSEEFLLKLSLGVTIVMGGVSVLFGLLANSSSIIFDGVYALVDGAMTALALVVARLIALYNRPNDRQGRLTERFAVGFWHLEPMVLGLNGILLMGTAGYALITAVDNFLGGGRVLAFDFAIVYAAVCVVLDLCMVAIMRIGYGNVRSDLIALDAKGWTMNASFSCALLAAFGFGAIIENTEWSWVAPYVDPAVLLIVCLFVIPMPLATVRQALADILRITPVELKRQVDAIAGAFVERHGFTSHTCYVTRAGRGTHIELYFLVPKSAAPVPLAHWDAIRNALRDALGEPSPDRWLVVLFTTEPEWAD